MRLIVILACTFVVCLTVSGCSSDPRKAIIGKWEAVKPAQDGGKFTYEFLEDGTVVVRTGARGKYEFVDDTHIKITSAPETVGAVRATATFTFRVKVSGDTLYLREGDGEFQETDRFNRAK